MIRKILLLLLELFEEKMECRIGQRAPYSGVYRDGDDYIALTKWERFPPNVNGVWKLVVKV